MDSQTDDSETLRVDAYFFKYGENIPFFQKYPAIYRTQKSAVQQNKSQNLNFVSFMYKFLKLYVSHNHSMGLYFDKMSILRKLLPRPNVCAVIVFQSKL